MGLHRTGNAPTLGAAWICKLRIGIIVDPWRADAGRRKGHNALRNFGKITGQILDRLATGIDAFNVVIGHKDIGILPAFQGGCAFIADNFIDQTGQITTTLDRQPPNPQIGGKEMPLWIITRHRIIAI